jgi:hypothetical protein
MSWPYLPDDFDQKYDSAWIWLPNSLYDPVKGHQLYQEYIDTLAYADELGFDFESCMQKNIDKLRVRYQGKFTEKAAQERNLAEEYKTLQ